MDSRNNIHILVRSVVAVVLYSAAFYANERLTPRWWAMWLGALPMLWIATCLPWPIAGVTSLVYICVNQRQEFDDGRTYRC